MSDHSEHSPLEEFKEKVEEVIELLNQSNLPLIVDEDGESAVVEEVPSGETAPAVQKAE